MQKNDLNENIRTFNIYFLLFVTFLVGYGRVFEVEWGSLGKHPENFLPLPIVLTLYLAFKGKRYQWPVTYREKIFALYAIFISLMPLWGLYLDESLGAIRQFWAAAAFAMLIMHNVREEKEIKLFIYVFMSGVATRACLSVFQYFDGIDKLRASFRHYNVYGNFLLLPLSFLLGLLLYDVKGKRGKAAYITLFILIGFTLLATMSRASVVAIVFSVAAFSIFVSRKALMMALIVPLFLGVFIYSKPESHISKRVMSVKWEDKSLQSRVKYIWPISVEIFKDHNPFWGIGSGNYKKLFMENYKHKTQFKGAPYAHDHPHVHNDFLQALVSQGLIGASMYLFFVFQTFYMSWIVFKRGISPFSKAIGASGLIWIVAHALAGIVHHEYTSVRYNMSVAFIVTIVLLSFYTSIKLESFRDKSQQK